MEKENISLGQSGGKSRLSELSTDETTEKTENVVPAVIKKATNFGLKLFNGAPKFPYKFNEIVSLIRAYV